MPQGIQHRVILVGVGPDARAPLDAALQARGGRVAADCGDAPAACRAASACPDESHLFLVGDADPTRVSALTASLPGQPVLALLPAGAGLNEAVALQRAGAAQVVPMPPVADDVGRALDCIAAQFAPPVRQARVIAVCGVSGGCGATTLALELAREVASREAGPGRPGCLLVEVAPRLGALATLLNVEPATTSHDLLTGPTRLTPQAVRLALTRAGPGLDVLVGPYREITPGAVTARSVLGFVETAKRLASAIVLDVPCTFDDVLFEVLARADQAVLVGVQTVASMRALKLVRDVLVREEGVRGPRLVVNRYDASLPGFEAPRLSELLREPDLFTVAADFPSLVAAAKHGKPLRDAAPHSAILPGVRRLAGHLLGGTPPRPSGDQLERALRGSPGPRSLRVLHIEDDAVQHYVVKLHLSQLAGYRCEVESATSEEQGVEAFGRKPFDLVILDYHLAQGNGLGCLRRLRAVDAMVPILVVSGLTEPTVAAELLEAGADDFLGKENLAGERLGRALTAALGRADGLRARHPEGEAGPVDGELLALLSEVRREARGGSVGAARLQRLADLVGDELDGGRATPLPRKALLALFLRLFGGEG